MELIEREERRRKIELKQKDLETLMLSTLQIERNKGMDNLVLLIILMNLVKLAIKRH